MDTRLEEALANTELYLREMLRAILRAQHGSLHALRELAPRKLGGKSCTHFLFIDIDPSLGHEIDRQNISGITQNRSARLLEE